MVYAEKILSGDLQPARDIGGDDYRYKRHKFSEMAGLEGKIIREIPPENFHTLIREVKATNILLGTYTDRYGIDTVNPQFVIAPGSTQGEASAVFICDKITNAKQPEEMVGDQEMVTAFDDLNLKLVQHVRDIYHEGGLYNTELMHFHQYVVSDGRAVLVDVEPHFVRVVAPPEGRIFGDVELVPIFDMVRELATNAVLLRQEASRPNGSGEELRRFIEELNPTHPVLLHAQAVLAEFMESGNFVALNDFFDDDEDSIGWNRLFHDQRAATYVADLPGS